MQRADRVEIWRTFLANVSVDIAGGQLSDEELEELAEKPMNGREVSNPTRKEAFDHRTLDKRHRLKSGQSQIKNTVFCATSIVRSRGEQLKATDIKEVLETLMDEHSEDDE